MATKRKVYVVGVGMTKVWEIRGVPVVFMRMRGRLHELKQQKVGRSHRRTP